MKLKSFLACLVLALPLAAQDDRPVVTGPWMNAGSSQRSMIQSIGVTFDRNVSSLVKLESLKVIEVKTGNPVDLSGATLIFDPRNNSANWMIDRDTTALLNDGNYLAWIEADTLLSEPRRAACAASALPLDDYVFGFHQMAGDTDGDRDVDFRDSCVLRETWLQTIDGTTFRSFLDFDLSSRVDESDRGLFAQTYFSLLPAEPAIHLFLRNDTGDNPSDNATSLYSFGFDTVELDGASSWKLSLGGLQTDITPTVTGGAGVVLESVLDNLVGSPLTSGNYSLTIEALDANGEVLASDALDFEYLGDVLCGPYFTSTPTPGVSLGQVEGAQPLNLSNWMVERWSGSQGPANWVVASDGLSVEQTVNAAPSAFIGPEPVLNLRITGNFRVDTNSDDDLMGFIFGYQNAKQFYLFDWKQANQGVSLGGMSIKRINAEDRELTWHDLWTSNADRANTTILSAPNGIGWEDFQTYSITLEFTPGKIVVEVSEEGTLLDRLEVEDNTFSGGRFGFYNYSQDSVVYNGFTKESLNNVYFYDSNAFDPDGGAITYSIGQNTDGSEAPEGATINPANGAIIWEPTEAGTFPFTILATDNDGLIDTQRFDVVVTPIDQPPVVSIVKTAPSVFPDEPISFQVVARDDEQLFRVRLFIDDLEVGLDEQFGFTTRFSEIGTKELRAVAIDSAEQVSEITSYVRVLDRNAINPNGQNTTPIAPPGQTPGTPTDLRPLVSFQAPTAAEDDPTLFVGTVNSNGSQLAQWFFEWAPAATVNFDNLASRAVLWQELAQGTDPFDAVQFATITPGNFPNELVAFRLRAANQNGLGAIATIVFNPQTNSTSGPTETINSGPGVASPTAAFTAPLTASDDRTVLRGTVDPTTGTLQSWVLDYTPQSDLNSSDLRDPSVAWTILAQNSSPVSNALLATLVPTSFSNQPYVFRLTAINEGGGGAIATVIFNPTSSNFGGPTGTTGVIPATAERPVCRIISPAAPGDDRSNLIGSIFSNGGTLARWIVDYAPRTAVNPQDLSDPSVLWTLLTEGTDEKDQEELAALDLPDFQNGLWIIRVRAFNTNGLGCLATTLLDTGDTSLPTVAILNPEAEGDITYITEARGTVTNGGGVLDSWALEIAPTSEVSLANLNTPANWRLIGSGNSPFDDEPLGMIDPTGLQNGSYILRLSARNTNGRGIADGIIIHVCGEAKLGNFRLEFQDLNIPLAGIPIQINRIYDTLNANRSGDFGFGWTLGIGDPDLRETVPDTGDSFFFATPFEIGTRVFLTTPDGRRVGFTFNVRNPRNRFLFVDYEPYFEPDPGVYETLTIDPFDFERVEVAEDGAVYTPLLPFGYNPDRYRLTTREGLTYHINQRNGLQRITDENNQQVTFSRNKITHSSGESISLIRDTAGRIVSIETQVGTELEYRYDSNGDLVEIENVTGDITRLRYFSSPAHYVESIANPEDASRGRYTRRIRYENGRFVGVEDGDGNLLDSQSFAPDQFSGTRTDALGNVTTLIYDARGNLVQETSPTGAISIIEYNDPANPDKETAIIDPEGFRTEYQYDSRGNVIQELDDAGNIQNLTYNAANKLTSLDFLNGTGASTQRIDIEYDANGNLIQISQNSERTRTFEYDDQGRITKRTGADGESILLEFSGNQPGNRPSKVTSSNGKILLYDHNFRNQVTQVRDENGDSINIEYDSKGRIVRTTDNQGNTEAYAYDSLDRIIQTVDALGRISRLAYDTLGNVISETKVRTDDDNLLDDAVTRIEYDAAGRIVSYQAPSGERTSYIRDQDGQVIQKTLPNGSFFTYAYDKKGDVAAIVDPLGRQRGFERNHRGEVLVERWLDASDNEIETLTFTRGSFGEILSTSDGRTSYTMAYNRLGELVEIDNEGSVDLPRFSISLERDTAGRIVTISDLEGASRSASFSSCCSLDEVRWQGPDGLSGGLRFTSNSLGATTAIERFSDRNLTNSVGSTQIVRDTLDGSISSIQHLDSSSNVIPGGWEFGYRRNSHGQVIEEVAQGSTNSYTYDQFGQVISATRTNSSLPDESYQYSLSGNRTSSHLTGEIMFDASGLPLEDDRYRYFYDAANNLIRRLTKENGDETLFRYDHRNRPTEVLKKDINGVEISSNQFRYDTFDRVVQRTVDGVTLSTSYVVDNPWADYDSSGNVVARYLHDQRTDGLLARWTPNTGVEWILSDQRNSVRGLMNNAGEITATADYDSFGNFSTDSTLQDAGLRFSFTGREHIVDSIFHYRSRLYDAYSGRFLSDDMAGVSAGDTNLQRYVFNDPLNQIDPTGKTTVDANFTSLSLGQQITVGLFKIGAGLAFTAKAAAVGAVTAAVVVPALDAICLLLTGESDKISKDRAFAKSEAGAKLGFAAGLAFGSVVLFNTAFSLSFGANAVSSTVGGWVTSADTLIKLPTFALITSGITIAKAKGSDRFDCDTPFFGF